MARINEVEHRHRIAVINQIASHVVIKFRFAVRYDYGLLPFDALDEVWANYSPALHGAGCAKYQNVPVEPRINRQADRLPVPFA